MLALAHINEARLVHDRIAYRPGVTEIVLLIPAVVVVAETRNRRTRTLERVVGSQYRSVIKVIVEAQALMIVDLVIKTERELICIIRAHRHRLVLVARHIGRWNKALQVNRSRILASKRDDARGKNLAPG